MRELLVEIHLAMYEETYVGHNILNRCHEDCKERNHSKQSLMYSFYAWLLYQIWTYLSRVYFSSLKDFQSFVPLLAWCLRVSCNRMGDAICVSYQYISLRCIEVCYEYSYSFDPQSHYTDLYKCCQGLIWLLRDYIACAISECWTGFIVLWCMC